MKALILLTLFSSLTLFASAQTANTKGLSVVQNTTEQKTTGKTYALVVGISKYKSNEIPSLQFADKDANAFANYLVASGVDSANITLLTNEHATYFNVMSELNAICTEKAKQGDKVFFYFSGHGDVESKVITKDGYLLPYDAPKIVYAISAMKVSDVQSYLATASANGVQVYLITDACHAGNLAGGSEGMKNIANVLGEKWKDEVKILSCQPGELSLEGKQWGEGRGLFSYELINGLAGMADKNHDRKVTLHELNLYLEDKVHEGALPSHQNPIGVGNPEKELTTVNEKYLKNISSHQNTNSFAAVDSRGMEEALLKNQTDSVKKWYGLYKMAMDSGYLSSTGYSDLDKKEMQKQGLNFDAYFCLKKIPQNENTELMLGLIKRNLAAKMIDEVNKNMNEIFSRKFLGYGILVHQIFYADEIKDLISSEKIKELGLMPKLLFLQSQSLSGNETINKIKLLDSALTYDKNASYILAYYIFGNGQLENKKINDLILKTKSALTISPKMTILYESLAKNYRQLKNYDSSNYYYKSLLFLDTSILRSRYTSMNINGAIAGNYFLMNQLDSSEKYANLYSACDSCIDNDSMKLATKLVLWANASDDLNKELELRKRVLSIKYNELLRRYKNAPQDLIAIQKKITQSEFNDKAFNANRCDEFYFFNTIGATYRKLSFYFLKVKDFKNSFEFLKLSLKWSGSSINYMSNYKDAPFYNSPEFKSLLKKYFPEKK